MKKHFLLDPKITFLNHGSFGACPKAVFDVYQEWQRELEYRPVESLGRRAISLLANSREKLADYLNCARDDLVYFPNPTTAINMVVRNFDKKMLTDKYFVIEGLIPIILVRRTFSSCSKAKVLSI